MGEKKDKKDKKEKKDKKKKLGKKSKLMKAGMKGKLIGKFGKAAAKKKAGAGPSVPKVLVKTEDDYEPVNRWWEREDGALSGKRGAKKWDSFEHHGVCFAAPYDKHKIPMLYDGKPYTLDPEAEEVAMYWVACRGSEYEKKDIFINNFWPAFTSRLSEELQAVIKDFSKCNFDAIWTERENKRM